MRLGLWLMSGLCLTGGLALGQPRRTPVPPPTATPAATPLPAPTPLPPPTSVTIAPPDEPGWTVVQVPGGYFRYRAEEPGAADGSEGGVTVVPAPPPISSAQNHRAERNAPTGRAIGQPSSFSPPPPDPCRQQREWLSQRLLELRGVELDPVTADFVWSRIQGGFVPHVQRSLYGRVLAGSDEQLLTAVLSDAEARLRAADYVHCVDQAHR